MSKHGQQFPLEAPPEQALNACRQAVADLGWRLLEQQPWRILAKEPGVSAAHMTYRAKVTIDVGSPEGSSGSVITLNGSNSPGMGPIQSNHLRQQMAAVQDAITAAAGRGGRGQPTPTAAQATPAAVAPAGWNPDPTGRHAQRYWDGAAWTEHVADPSGQFVDPLEQPTVEEVEAEQPPPTEVVAAPTEAPPTSVGFKPAAECAHCGHALARLPTGEFGGSRDELREDLLYRQVGCGNCGAAVCFECSAEAAARHGRPGQSQCPDCGALLMDA